MTTRRARYPQPPPAAAVLAEVAARNFCAHDSAPGRCPWCRAAAQPPDDQDVTMPAAASRPPRRRPGRARKDELTDVAVQGELFTQGETTVRPRRW